MRKVDTTGRQKGEFQKETRHIASLTSLALLGAFVAIACYSYCCDNSDPSVPTLVLIGEKDDGTPAAACQAVMGKANFKVVVYPGTTHGFTEPLDKPFDVDGHHHAHDEAATKDAQQRANAFIDEHLK